MSLSKPNPPKFKTKKYIETEPMSICYVHIDRDANETFASIINRLKNCEYYPGGEIDLGRVILDFENDLIDYVTPGEKIYNENYPKALKQHELRMVQYEIDLVRYEESLKDQKRQKRLKDIQKAKELLRSHGIKILNGE